MQTRSLLTLCGALCVSLLMMSETAIPAHAGGWRSGWRGGSGSLYVNNAYYYDVRDTRLYSAQGYDVPVTVPVAPIVRTYNYGWGVPSARLSPIGGYAAWYPDVPFTQNGGRLPGGQYPMVYHPTDTTQFGFYYNYVPSWQPR